jgi:GNAT superfamily N-acetyltransferase
MAPRIRAFAPSDLPSVVAIVNANHPNHPTSLDEAQAAMRDADRLELIRYVAEDATAGGASVGRGTTTMIGWGQVAHMPWMFHARKYELRLEVEPGRRREGIGRALFDRLLGDLREREALLARASATEGDDESIGFAVRRGFHEVWRNLESRLDVSSFDPGRFAGAEERVAGQGITIATLPEELARDPDALRKVYDMNLVIARDQAELDVLTVPPFEEYVADEVDGPVGMSEAWFLARDGDAIVGASTLQRLPGSTDVVETGHTAVHPDYRGRGIALALKLRTIEYASQRGIAAIQTDSNAGNERMLAINRALGFASQPARITFELQLDQDGGSWRPAGAG